MNAGKTLYRLYDLTHKEKYRKAMDTIYSQLQGQPRTKEGNFWHKEIYPDQIWLDGLYMAQPFYMQYELSFCGGNACQDSFKQFQTVRELMRCEKNGLYYHAYDSSRKMFWCDKVTGLSSNFWLRAEGWFAMAIADTWEIMPESMSAERDELKEMFCELIDAMLPYQDEESGMWYQVINLGGIKPNYLETSGSAIFAYAESARTFLTRKTAFFSSTTSVWLPVLEILICAKVHLSTICVNQLSKMMRKA